MPASPQLEHGRTEIANETLDAWCCCPLFHDYIRIYFCVIRLTYGWKNKGRGKGTWISTAQFIKLSGIDQHHVNRAINTAKEKGLIKITKRKRGGWYCYPVKDYELWEVPNDLKDWHKNVKRYEVSTISGGNEILNPPPVVEKSPPVVETSTISGGNLNGVCLPTSDLHTPKEKKESTIKKKTLYGENFSSLSKNGNDKGKDNDAPSDNGDYEGKTCVYSPAERKNAYQLFKKYYPPKGITHDITYKAWEEVFGNPDSEHYYGELTIDVVSRVCLGAKNYAQECNEKNPMYAYTWLRSHEWLKYQQKEN